jgi:cytochrome b
MAKAPAGAAPVRLWDRPTRLIHWSFVLLIPAMWWTGKHDNIGLHETLGYVLIGLLAFRILWGFAGASTARFAGFVRGPKAVFRYLFSKPAEPVVGHNPLGGWSVLALLGLMIGTVSAGLIAQDVDGIESGPLSHYFSYETADAARHWHGLLFNLLLAMVLIHLAAILFYLVVKRDNLVRPMITGRKPMPSTPAIAFAPVWRVAVIAAMAGGFAYWIARGAPL